MKGPVDLGIGERRCQDSSDSEDDLDFNRSGTESEIFSPASCLTNSPVLPSVERNSKDRKSDPLIER